MLFMNIQTAIFALSILVVVLIGCDNSASKMEKTDANVGNVTKFDGTWEVIGRTGNEDGTNEPVCGSETAIGIATISGTRVKGDIVNKSGFEYTFDGTIDANGRVTGMMLYSGYDAAKIDGTFYETTGKGTWEDALNACPGVWHATRRSRTSEPAGEVPAETQQTTENKIDPEADSMSPLGEKT